MSSSVDHSTKSAQIAAFADPETPSAPPASNITRNYTNITSSGNSSLPPLRILTTPTRRRKGNRYARKKTRDSASDNDVKGLLSVLLVVAFFVTLEVIVVDRFFLGPTDIYNNVELRVLSSTHNVFLSDIVEAGFNRYYRAGEFKKLLLRRRKRGDGDGAGEDEMIIDEEEENPSDEAALVADAAELLQVNPEKEASQ